MDKDATTAESRHILVVEDDNNLANIYVTRLEAEGFTVTRAKDGEEAMVKTVEIHPNLIVLDVMMPKVDGFNVLDILRHTPETANTKIVVLTALGQDSDRQKAEDLGADAYLVKTQVTVADVVKRIREVLSN